MNRGFYAKIHRAQGKILVAICDEEILGKEFREGDIVLSVPPSFYKGEKVDLRQAIELIRIADIAVITGKRIVTELIREGLASPLSVLKVGDQLHMQIIREVYQL